MHDGVCVTGASSYMKNLDQLIQQETGLKIMKMDEPEMTVVKGLGMIMENPSYERLANALEESSYQ